MLLNMKIVDCCESNKPMGCVCVSRIISMKPSKLEGKTAGSQGSLDKHVQNVGDGAQGKNHLLVKNTQSKP